MQNDETKRDEEIVVNNTDYIDAIKSLKENSVSKDKYDALEAEKKQLLDALISGQEVNLPDEGEKLGSRIEYYKKYKENKFSSNLEFWDNFCKLRKATIEEYGADPTVTGNFGLTPEGDRIEPSYGEADAMEKEIGVIEQMIEEADGNPIVFDALMQSAIKK